jgi:hypothetical protein
MDEQELRSLFSAAPGDLPVSSFSKDDVVRESRRQAARRRNGLAVTGSALALAVAGFGLFGLFSGGLPIGPTAASDKGAASANSAQATGQPSGSAERPLAGGETPNFSSQPSQQGGDGGVKTGPRAEGAFGCEQVDRELAIALAGELPAHVTPSEATSGGACSTAARSAGFRVPGGSVSVAVFPLGSTPLFKSQPQGSLSARAVTASGGTLVLVSTPDVGGAAPYAGDLDRFARDLAPGF